MSLLDISNLSLSIGALPILRDVTLSIAAGEILAVTGESGSGKSMTAFSVMRLLPQAAKIQGAIYLEDEDLCALSEVEMCQRRGRDIGMVFQEPMTALNPVMTIGAQVMETILLHTDTSVADAQAEAARVLTWRPGVVGCSFSPLPLCCAALVLSFLLRRYCLVVLWVCFAWVPSYTTAWLQESAVEVAVELM